MKCSWNRVSKVAKVVAGFVGIVSCSVSQSGFAWGRLGHQMVGEVAADLSTNGKEFWQANRTALGELADVPDSVWKGSNTVALEKPTHWFQINVYTKNSAALPTVFLDYLKSVAQYTEPVIIKNGTAPWRSEQMYQLAVEAFKKGDFARGLQMTGALAHYIGDLSQPLHVTDNYDGQMTGSVGIHKFFETTNLESAPSSALWQSVESKGAVALERPEISGGFKGAFLSGVYAEVQRTSSKVNTVLQNDKSMGRGGKGAQAQLELASDQLADGAATLSVILNSIWAASGQKDVAQVVNVQDPQFVPPQFGVPAPSKGKKPASDSNGVNSIAAEDCL